MYLCLVFYCCIKIEKPSLLVTTLQFYLVEHYYQHPQIHFNSLGILYYFYLLLIFNNSISNCRGAFAGMVSEVKEKI